MHHRRVYAQLFAPVGSAVMPAVTDQLPTAEALGESYPLGKDDLSPLWKEGRWEHSLSNPHIPSPKSNIEFFILDTINAVGSIKRHLSRLRYRQFVAWCASHGFRPASIYEAMGAFCLVDRGTDQDFLPIDVTEPYYGCCIIGSTLTHKDKPRPQVLCMGDAGDITQFWFMNAPKHPGGIERKILLVRC